MFKLNLKIAWRNLRRDLVISIINIGGLGIALAAFLLIALYVRYETSYDKINTNYDNIYLVGRDLKDYKTNYTPPPLSKLIKQYCPEVELVGKMQPSNLDFALISKGAKVYVKNWLVVDYNAAKMFNLKPEHGLQRPKGRAERLSYLNKESMHILFPGKKDGQPVLVALGSTGSGITAKISGSIVADQHSNINFDALAVANELGGDEGFGYPNYLTYIQVKPGTNISDLQSKIDRLLKVGMAKEHDLTPADNNKRIIFLDPLSKLHLKPESGNNTNFKVVVSLFVLGLLIVVIACINFTNLSIAQANKRAKEIGVKKVLGAYRKMLGFQFLIETLVQCFLSVIIGLILTELCLPAFNNLFQVPLSLWSGARDLYWILPLLLLIITLLSGIYPAVVLSGYKPAEVLKGNFQTGITSQWLRKTLLAVQFTIAIIFIAGILIVSTQIKYMQTEDSGFNAGQVVIIKNMMLFDKPEVFAPVRDKILKIKGVRSATVASNVPDGSMPGSNSYTIEGKETSLDFVDVDFDYFETLGIKLKTGRFFSPFFKTDMVNSAIINETAASKFGLQDPIGKVIRGCHLDYRVVGVIKDFKSQGFENVVEPTIYAIDNPCGNALARTNIMIKVDANQMSAVLATLKASWSDINKRDGENFRYEFLDELYGRLFKKQEQLQSLVFVASVLTIFIAVVGLFAFSKFMTNNKSKEIAIRKILGATDFQLLRLLNSSFFWMLLLSNLVAWPVVYVLAGKWLDTFAYRIELSIIPFATAGMISLFLTLLTVNMQASKAIHANPADVLKYD
jgi:putative ABC transport system permease protein